MTSAKPDHTLATHFDVALPAPKPASPKISRLGRVVAIAFACALLGGCGIVTRKTTDENGQPLRTATEYRDEASARIRGFAAEFAGVEPTEGYSTGPNTCSGLGRAGQQNYELRWLVPGKYGDLAEFASRLETKLPGYTHGTVPDHGFDRWMFQGKSDFISLRWLWNSDLIEFYIDTTCGTGDGSE